jgi:hypothetical protein
MPEALFDDSMDGPPQPIDPATGEVRYQVCEVDARGWPTGRRLTPTEGWIEPDVKLVGDEITVDGVVHIIVWNGTAKQLDTITVGRVKGKA